MFSYLHSPTSLLPWTLLFIGQTISLGLLTTSYGSGEGAEKAQKKSGKGRITKEIREMLTKNIPHSCQNVSN